MGLQHRYQALSCRTDLCPTGPDNGIIRILAVVRTATEFGWQVGCKKLKVKTSPKTEEGRGLVPNHLCEPVSHHRLRTYNVISS